MSFISQLLTEEQVNLVQKLGLLEAIEQLLQVLSLGKITAKEANSQIITLIDNAQKTDQDFVIDLHLGGEDHIDVHHKNEILQSEALGFHLSKYWVHNKFVLVGGKKMSKSLGNVYLINGKFEDTGFYSFENPPVHEFSEEFKEKIIKKYKELKLYDIVNIPPAPLKGGVEEECERDSRLNFALNCIGKRPFNFPFVNYDKRLTDRSGELRNGQTEAEKIFWDGIRSFEILKDLTWNRQKPIGGFIADFYCRELNLIVEIDGSSHDQKQDYDQERDNILKSNSLEVLRFTNNEVNKNLDQVLEKILNWSKEKSPFYNKKHPPQPSLKGGSLLSGTFRGGQGDERMYKENFSPFQGGRGDAFWHSFRFDPLAYRLMMFEHHYTQQMDFTWEKLWQSQMRLWGLRKEAMKVKSFWNYKFQENGYLPRTEADQENKLKIKNELLENLTNNLDLPKFVEKYTQLLLEASNKIKDELIPNYIYDNLINFEVSILCLELFNHDTDEKNDLGNLPNQRQQAKLAKDWAKADELRSQIQQLGWQIDDYPWGWGVWWRGC